MTLVKFERPNFEMKFESVCQIWSFVQVRNGARSRLLKGCAFRNQVQIHCPWALQIYCPSIQPTNTQDAKSTRHIFFPSLACIEMFSPHAADGGAYSDGLIGAFARVQARPADMAVTFPGHKMHVRSISNAMRAIHVDLAYVKDALSRWEGDEWALVVDSVSIHHHPAVKDQCVTGQPPEEIQFPSRHPDQGGPRTKSCG